jgi:hypothetical protein
VLFASAKRGRIGTLPNSGRRRTYDRAERAIDIGIHTSAEALEDKLEERENPRKRDLTWNLTRLPEFSGEGPHRLFVATSSVWQGYFILKDEVLFSPEDTRCPYALLFDPRSWVEIKPLKTKRFRGFTYNTPAPAEIIPASLRSIPASMDPGHTRPGSGGSTRPGSGSSSDRE